MLSQNQSEEFTPLPLRTNKSLSNFTWGLTYDHWYLSIFIKVFIHSKVSSYQNYLQVHLFILWLHLDYCLLFLFLYSKLSLCLLTRYNSFLPHYYVCIISVILDRFPLHFITEVMPLMKYTLMTYYLCLSLETAQRLTIYVLPLISLTKFLS